MKQFTDFSFLFAGLLVLFFKISLNADPIAIQNPGFEQGKDSWMLFVGQEDDALTEKFIISSENTHGGLSCASVISTKTNRVGIESSKGGFAVTPKERYRLTAWVRYGEDSIIRKGCPSAYIRACLRKNLSTDIDSPLLHMHIGLDGKMARTPFLKKVLVTEVPKEWTKIEGVIEIPEDTKRVGIGLFSEGVLGTVYWDDVSIEQVADDTPLSEEIR